MSEIWGRIVCGRGSIELWLESASQRSELGEHRSHQHPWTCRSEIPLSRANQPKPGLAGPLKIRLRCVKLCWWDRRSSNPELSKANTRHNSANPFAGSGSTFPNPLMRVRPAHIPRGAHRKGHSSLWRPTGCLGTCKRIVCPGVDFGERRRVSVCCADSELAAHAPRGRLREVWPHEGWRPSWLRKKRTCLIAWAGQGLCCDRS